MSDITPHEVVQHIRASMDNDGSNPFDDDYGYTWYVYSEGNDLRVSIEKEGEAPTVYTLVPKRLM